MLSSPMKIYYSTPQDDSTDTYSSSSEFQICDCQSQLGHFDWNGNPHENLPDLCKQTMGIRAENIKNGKQKSNNFYDKIWHTY